MTDLTTEEGQKQHYAQVRERLRASPKPKIARGLPMVMMVHKPAPAAPAPAPIDIPHIEEANGPDDPLDIPASVINARWKDIVREVCAKHGIGINDIRSRTRARNIVAARYEAIYRLRQETLLSLPEIGRRMGGFDHSTVIYSIAKHKAFMAAQATEARA